MSNKSLQITITGNTSSAVAEVSKLVEQYDQLIRQLSKVQELSRGKGASGGGGAAGPVKGVADAAEEAGKKVQQQVKAAKEAVASIDTQWKGATLSQQANIRKWGNVSVEELKRAVAAQDRQLQGANKIMTQKGFLGFGGAGQLSGQSARDSAKVFESYFKELDRVSKLNKEMTAKGGFEWLTGKQAKTNAEASAKVFEKQFAAQDKAIQRMEAQREKATERDRIQTEKRLKQQIAFGDKYMQAVGKAAQQHGIFVDPKKAAGGMQVVAGDNAQWMKHDRGVYVRTAQDAEILRGKIKALGFTAMEQQGLVRGFATEVGSMMKTQARWFVGAGLIFGGMAAIRTGVKSTMEFYQNLKNIQAITGESEAGIRAVGRAALEVAENTPVAAGEASKFALKLIQAGLSAKEAAVAMRTVAELVTVTGESSEEVAKAVTTAMFAWRKEASEIPDIGQKIAAALNFSRLTVQDLGTAFNYLATTASLMGKPLEETTAIMAVMSNMGIRASTIGTGISQLFTELIVPSKKLKAELKSLGVALGDVDPTANKFADIVDRLREKGFSAAKAYDVLQVRAGRQLASALVATGDAFRIMEDRISKSTQLTEGLKSAMEGPINKLKKMRNQLENAAILMGSVSVPAIDALTSAMTMLTTIIRQVAQGVSTLVEWFGSKFISAVMVTGGLLLGLTKIYTKYAASAALATLSTRSFSLALMAFGKANPIITALTIISAALGLIGVIAGRSTKELKEALDEQGKWVKHSAKEHDILNSIIQMEEQAVTALKDEWNSLGQVGGRVGVLFEVRGLIDGFRLASSAIRDVNLEMEILEEKLNKLKQEGDQPAKNQTLSGMYGLGGIGAIKEAEEAAKRNIERRNEEFNIIQKLGKEEEKKQKLLTERFDKGDELLGVKLSVKDVVGAAITDDGLSEMEKLSLLTESLQQEWDGLQERLKKARENLLDFQKTYKESTATNEDKKTLKGLESDYESAVNMFGVGDARIVEAAKMAGGEIKKRIIDAAQKASDALKTARAESKRFQFDLSQIGREDPFADIFINGQEEADRFAEKILNVERQILKVKADRKGASGPTRATLDKHLSDLEKQKSILEGQKGLVPEKTSAELRAKANEVILDQTRQRIQLEQELGRLLSMDAFRLEMEADRKVLDMEREHLQVQKELAVGDEERLKALSLFEKTLSIKEKIQALKEEAGFIKAMSADYARAQESLGLLGAMGADVSLSKQYLDFEQKMNDIIARRPELAKLATAALFRMQHAMSWMDKPPNGEAWYGFLMNLRIGVEETYQGLGNAFVWVQRIGTDSINNLQRSSSDFFYNLSTAQGFDQEQHANFWEYFKDVVDDFLKSVYQSFMRTLADIWSAWLTKGIINMLGGVLDGKNAIASADAQAAAQSMTLTGALMGQVSAVGSLTTAYWALAAAKAAAGMGGGVAGAISGGGSSGGYSLDMGQTNWFPSIAVPHTGGFIPKYHNGGKVLPSERMALLEVGEFVVNRRSAARNKETLMAINNGQDVGGGGQPAGNNITIIAADAKSFSDMVKRNPSAIVGVVNNDLRMAGSTRTSIRNNL